jgi:hypothetical protein
MAIEWLGRAKAVAQVTTHTVGGTPAAAQVYSLVTNGKTISYTAGVSDTNTTIATALAVLLNASTIPEFSAVTWTDATGVITGTHDTAGTPRTFTSSATGTGTFVTATSTAATGPNHWDNTANWSGGAVPISTDDVVIGVPVDILYGLDQNAVTLTSLTILASFTAKIGLPRVNALGYTEDLDTYLKISATTVKIGVGDGNGSGRIKINFGSNATTVEVRKTGTALETGVPSVVLLGTHANNAIDCQSGSTSTSIFALDASTWLTARVATNATFVFGEGVTLGTLTGEGTVRGSSAVTTMTQNGGSWTLSGASAVTTLTQREGATLYYNSSGTITTANIWGTVDCSGDASARTFTTTTLGLNGVIYDPFQTITHTNKIAIAAGVRRVTAS